MELMTLAASRRSFYIKMREGTVVRGLVFPFLGHRVSFYGRVRRLLTDCGILLIPCDSLASLAQFDRHADQRHSLSNCSRVYKKNITNCSKKSKAGMNKMRVYFGERRHHEGHRVLTLVPM